MTISIGSTKEPTKIIAYIYRLMKVRIKERSSLARIAAWKMGTTSAALTLGRTIHLHKASRQQLLNDKAWICHELAHVKQYMQYGILSFLFLYLLESVRKGYYHNRFEVAARQAEKDCSLLAEVQFT